jgi:hypothetical protein
MENTIHSQGFIRSYKWRNFEIGSIRFFDPQTSTILYTTSQGWLETGGYGSDVKSLKFTQEIKRKIKENLNIEFPYVLKDNEKNGVYRQRYILYIPLTESPEGWQDNGEFIRFSTEEEDRIYREYEITLESVTEKDPNFNYRKIKLYEYVRTEKKTFGNEVDKWLAEFEQEGINIKHFELVQLLKKYNLTKK